MVCCGGLLPVLIVCCVRFRLGGLGGELVLDLSVEF